MIKRYYVSSSVALFFLLHTFLLAGTTGKISGKITDSKTKDGIPSAIVTVTGTTLGAAADFEGNYVILNVPPGTYSVTVSIVGYQPTRVNNVGVNVDYTTNLNIELHESSVELNEFVVEGERNPLIRQDQTNPIVAVTAENIQALPVTSIAEVIGMQAGVVVDDAGDIHIRGGRSNEISYTLNGISVNDPYNNLSSIGVATNAVQEVTVSTGTFSAEYGNALSGVVNYVTKEGGSKLSGSIRGLTGDYLSKDGAVFPHINSKQFEPFNTSRLEGTLGGPTPIENLSFYASGVYTRSNGYLFSNKIYNTTDMFVTRDDLTKRLVYKDTLGNVLSDPVAIGYPAYLNDPRSGSNSDPYYFSPIGRTISYKRGLIRLSDGSVVTGEVPVIDRIGGPTGDSSLVPLNTSQAYNLQGNISYRLSSTMRLKYEIVADNADSKSASRTYWYNPDGRPTTYTNSIIHTIDWTHTINNAMFYTAKFSYSENNVKIYTFADIHDPRYLPSFYQTSLPIVGYLTGGTSLGRTFRTTISRNAKVDFQAQMFEVHEVKAGVELQLHSLDYENYALEFYDVNNPSRVINDFQNVYSDSIQYAARIPSVNSGFIHYQKSPAQFSAYIQDKIELEKSMILNIGLRYEYFDPADKYNPDISTALSARDTSFLTKNLLQSSIKTMLSPRFSINYPITDQGTIRFSYGHFYQFGNLASLYANSNFSTQGTQPGFGNANVKPQRSIQYELGLQQGLTPDLRLEVVGFYKDVRDYIYSQLVITSKGDLKYNVLTNLSYANVRGLTVSLFQRRAPGSMFSSSVDYTFSIAEGNRTEPAADFFYSEASGKGTETFLVPLDFDRRHVLNTTLNLSDADNFSTSTIIRLQSGTPYTPGIPASLSTQLSNFIQNSGVKPFQWSVDLKIEKYFLMSGLKYSVFLQVDNLFDTRNEQSVYANSGRALYNANIVADPAEFQQIRTRIDRGDVGLIPISAVDNYYVDPTNVSAPRLVRFGVSVLF